MRKYISKGKKKNKDEWVEGDYLFNDKTKNHLIGVGTAFLTKPTLRHKMVLIILLYI